MNMPSREDNSLPNLLYVLSVIFTILPSLIVFLRFKAKPPSERRIFLDDWFILLALLSCIIYAAFAIIGVAAGGLGRPLKRDAAGDPIFDSEFFMYQRASYVTNVVQMTALGPTKLAVLLLYRRIFNIDSRGDGRVFHAISMTLVAFVAIWTVAFFWTNVFNYTPISDQWTKPPSEANGTYEDVTTMYNAQCFADMTLDVFIIILPIPQVWKLHISLRRKLQISGIFMLGIITIAASVARAVIQYGVAAEFAAGNPDQTQYLAPHIYWVLIEISVGIIAASLPLLRPLGKIYSFRNVIMLSAKAISSIFTSSRTRTELTDGDTTVGNDAERTSNSSRAGLSSHDKWMRRYDDSCGSNCKALSSNYGLTD
ncbi:hypothetical protein B0I35DRAFT_117866 [Stachybotrys elegans]|uniref:Rhodopsin domain-containing protein n=1 Tax=Stachybotrys elegans TaxID=80388 RepID=A0A8K0SYV4_9HYPO|nr:hypothetical protein B0I35DRAFT_117866 [Stachybotrys elegans]